MAATRTASARVSAGAPGGQRISGRQAWRLLWASSRLVSLGVIAWVVAGAVIPPLVVASLGFVVGGIPAAVLGGINSASGRRLIGLLAVAAIIYAASLVTDPVGGALGTAARQRVAGGLQARLLRAVSTPVGISHLEDQEHSTGWPARRGR